MSLKRWTPTFILKSLGHPKQEKEERWRRERGRKRKKGKGGGRKGKRTKCDIWKLLVFPAGFQLCLLYCRVIVSNSKEDWEIFLDKHIASLNKIKVLCVRKKRRRIVGRWEAGRILGKQQSITDLCIRMKIKSWKEKKLLKNIVPSRILSQEFHLACHLSVWLGTK